jgi:hypothetical protein
MANKKVSQLVSKPSVLVTDLFPIADPTTGQLYKTTISDLGTAIGSGVSSVNTLVGAVVLDTDDIQELASPTNRWYTDTRARAAISGGTGISYNSGTGVITNAVTSGQIATALGYTPANGANYLALAGGTMGGAITGTIATFASSTSVTALGITLSGASGDGVKITHSAGRAFNIQSSGGGFGILINNETASTSAPFTIQKQGASVITLTDAGAGSFASSLTANSFVKTSGTSSQFLKADGSIDSTAYQAALTNPVTGTGTSGIVAKFNGTSTITDSIIYDNGTRVSIGANVTTSNTFTAVASTTSAYAVVAQASGAANGFWAVLSGTGEIFRGQTNGGSYFIVNNGGNAFLNGNLNIGDFGSTSFKLNVIGTANITGALSGTSATFSQPVGITTTGTTAAIQVTLPGNANATILSANSGNASFGWKLQMEEVSTGDFRIFRRESGVDYQVLNLARATGAATFSSSVTASGLISGSASIYQTNASGSIASNVFESYNGGATELRFNFPVSGSVGFNNGSTRLAITSAGNVGIGTTAPDRALTVNGQIGLNNDFVSTKGGTTFRIGYDAYVGNSAVNLFTESTVPLAFGTNATERMRITSGGEVQVNNSMILAGGGSNGVISIGDTTTASNGIYINTQTFTHRFAKFSFQGNPMGEIFYNGINTTYAVSGSDFRLKKNIDKWDENVLDLFKDINPKLFNWNFQKDSDTKSKGFIAQEMTSKFPEAYHLGSDNMYLYNPSGMVVYLIKAVQELEAKIKTLENK